jgi:hypothetical protein
MRLLANIQNSGEIGLICQVIRACAQDGREVAIGEGANA